MTKIIEDAAALQRSLLLSLADCMLAELEARQASGAVGLAYRIGDLRRLRNATATAMGPTPEIFFR